MLTISEIGGDDFSVLAEPPDEDPLEYAASVVANRWARGEGSGSYRVARDGRFIGTVHHAEGDRWSYRIQAHTLAPKRDPSEKKIGGP